MKEVDYIIVFGCHIKNILNKRLKYFLCVKNEYKYNKIVLSGGIGKFGNYNESLYMKDYLLKNNIEEEDLIIEDKSTTTTENIINIIELLKLNNLDNKSKIVLVTNRLHMYRIKKRLKRLLKNNNIEFEYKIVKS